MSTKISSLNKRTKKTYFPEQHEKEIARHNVTFVINRCYFKTIIYRGKQPFLCATRFLVQKERKKYFPELHEEEIARHNGDLYSI